MTAQLDVRAGDESVRRGRFLEAAEHFRRALEAAPDDARIALSLGAALSRLGRPKPAAAAFAHATRLAPDWAQAHVNLGLALLAAGEWERGWQEFEWRRRLLRTDAFEDADIPDWTGEPMPGHLMISTEQGFGDTLQFARLLPEAASRAGSVTVAVRPELRRLFEASFPACAIVGEGDGLSRPDAHLPLVSLARVFATRPEAVPAPIPYLTAPPERVQAWRERLAALPRPRLGLVWASAGGGDDALRKSASLADFAPLAGLGATVSLQKGPPAAEAATPPAGLALVDWGAELHDFAETAALIQGLDAVVSVDTAVLHLAAALGVQTFGLIQHIPDWRWPPGQERTPWYPAMRLFHQGRDLRWGDAIASLAGTLPPLLALGPR